MLSCRCNDINDLAPIAHDSRIIAGIDHNIWCCLDSSGREPDSVKGMSDLRLNGNLCHWREAVATCYPPVGPLLDIFAIGCFAETFLPGVCAYGSTTAEGVMLLAEQGKDMGTLEGIV